MGQALLGQRHAQAQRLIGWNEDRLAVAPQPVRDAQGLEPADDLGAVLERHPAVEQGVGRLDRAQDEKPEEGKQAERGRAKHEQPDRAERTQRSERARRGRGRVTDGGGLFGARRGRAQRLLHRLVGRWMVGPAGRAG
jgi:hypothetical protein